jgi:CelD/BcsL family acetyltransferase involved in cellulose biosynthesis
MTRIISITSLTGLRSLAAAWDGLWQRSEVTLPTARAELVAQWVERFAPRARFHSLVVEDGGQWVGALPLICRRVAGTIHVGALPSGAWSSGGEFLWDPAQAAEQQQRNAAALIEAFGRLRASVLWLEGMVQDRSGWQALHRATTAGNLAWDCRRRWLAGRVEIGHDWPACCSDWSRRHRQKVHACLRRLARRGEVRLRLLTDLPPDAVEPWLHQGFQIEDRSWKGDAETSVLRTPGMFDFFLRQARQAAEWGQLELAFLECGPRPVAFAYGLSAKGVFHSCKIGYDPEYADCAPGQCLRYHLLQRFHADPHRRAIDFLGPLTPSHACWRPRTYPVVRLGVAVRGWLPKAAIRAYQRWNGRGDAEVRTHQGRSLPIDSSPSPV